MSVESLSSRIDGIFRQLMASHGGGRELSSATKGTERELFISHLLAHVFPPQYRFSSGEVVDAVGNQSGQLDIVFEHPQGFSFPMHSGGPRLFLAENVSCAIEVKSNLADQWQGVLSTAQKLSAVHRGPNVKSDEWLEAVAAMMNKEKAEHERIPFPSPRIPLFAVGFEGWASAETAKKHLEQADAVDGVFILDSRTFIDGPANYSVCHGERSLVRFLECIRHTSIATFYSYILASYGYFRQSDCP